MTEPIKLPPLEIFDKGLWVWKGQEFTGAELDAAAFAKYRLAVEQATAELLRELTTLQRWYADVSMRAEKAEAEAERLRANHAEDQSVIAVWRGRTQRAEAEVERLRAALTEIIRYAKGVHDPHLEELVRDFLKETK